MLRVVSRKQWRRRSSHTPKVKVRWDRLKLQFTYDDTFHQLWVVVNSSSEGHLRTLTTNRYKNYWHVFYFLRGVEMWCRGLRPSYSALAASWSPVNYVWRISRLTLLQQGVFVCVCVRATCLYTIFMRAVWSHHTSTNFKLSVIRL